MLFQSVSFMLKFDFIVAKLETISEIIYQNFEVLLLICNHHVSMCLCVCVCERERACTMRLSVGIDLEGRGGFFSSSTGEACNLSSCTD